MVEYSVPVRHSLLPWVEYSVPFQVDLAGIRQCNYVISGKIILDPMPPSPLPVFGTARVFELGGSKFNIGGIIIQHRVPLIQHRVLRIQLRVLLIQHRKAPNSTSQCS